MTASDPFAEWTRCGRLRQVDIDRLLAAGVPIMAIAEGPRGAGYALARDLIVPHPAEHRFEFSRHDAVAGEGVPALIVVALGEDGLAQDLVAFRPGLGPGPDAFVGSWLGRAAVLGTEQLGWARDLLPVHPDLLSWLRSGREGVCIVDPARAGAVLRETGPIEVGSFAERRRLLDAMAVRLPRVTVRATERRVAA